MPRYEFVEGNSSKFWEITLEGSSYTVRWGKIGSDGQTKTKDFADAAKARKEYDKLIAEKTGKGYELVGDDEDEDGDEGEGEDVPDAPSNPDLESAIRADPTAEAPWLVYADWLQGQDDPRGALIVAQIKGKKDAKKLLDQHKTLFLSRFAEGSDLASHAQIEWERGFWSKLRVSCDYDNASEIPEDIEGVGGIVRYALRHPSARFLQKLDLGLTEGVEDGEANWQGSIDAVAETGPHLSLRELHVGAFEFPDETEISWTSIGSVGALWAACPALEKLTVQGGSIELGTISAPTLRELRLWTGGLPKEPVEQLTRATLPELEHLELWFGAEDYGAECSAADLTELLTGKGLPKLKRLGLMNAEFSNELPAMLAASALLPRIEVLDLSMGTLTDDGGRALLERASAFKHLKELVLDRNYLSGELTGQLQAALPQSRIGDQQRADRDYVYVSVGE